MKDEAFEMCMLFDFYGSILTERQQEVLIYITTKTCRLRRYRSTPI